jgi:hypothetical protein
MSLDPINTSAMSRIGRLEPELVGVNASRFLA